jgi:hypothetical protein
MRAASILLALVAGAALALGGGLASSHAAAQAAKPVVLSFTGKGGGRYLDVTRWLRDDTRDCYARRTADETVSVQWRLQWRASLVRTARGYVLRNAKLLRPSIAGSVEGKTVRDACDVSDAELDPNWVGSDRCSGPLPVKLDGRLEMSGRHAQELFFRGPIFGSAPKPCELSVRNDQLAAHIPLSATALARLGAGRALALPVGTAHPRPGDDFLARHVCSAFPHIYEGVVYIYDCDDTLVWKGTVTLRPA